MEEKKTPNQDTADAAVNAETKQTKSSKDDQVKMAVKAQKEEKKSAKAKKAEKQAVEKVVPNTEKSVDPKAQVQKAVKPADKKAAQAQKAQAKAAKKAVRAQKAAAKAANRRPKKFRSLQKSQRVAGRCFVYVWFVGFLLFVARPLVQSLQFSFSRVSTTRTGLELQFLGWDNYQKAFVSDAEFIPLLIDTLSIMAMDIVMGVFFSLFIAVLLNRKFRGRGLVRAAFFLPVIIMSGALMSVMSSDMSAQFSGAAGGSGMPLLRTVDFKTMLLQMTNYNPMVEYFTNAMDRIYDVIWKSGVQILLFLSGLQSISPSLYESASIEGCTAWEAFWKITFPMISPIIIVNVVYTVVDSFTDINNKTLEYIQDTAFGTTLDYGYSSALSWIYFAIIAVVLVIVVGLISRKAFYMND